MYSIGEIVLYGSNGVCEITEITTKKIGKNSIEYYVLKPVCSDSSTLFVPTQNEMLVSRMRVVLSSDEIKDILSQKTDNEIWIDNKAERCEKIKEIMYELEKTTDAAEHVGKILRSLIVKYA